MKFMRLPTTGGKRPTPFLATMIAYVASVGIAVAATEAESNTAFIFLDNGESTFWHTATNATLALPIDFPIGASSATLTISAPR